MGFERFNDLFETEVLRGSKFNTQLPEQKLNEDIKNLVDPTSCIFIDTQFLLLQGRKDKFGTPNIFYNEKKSAVITIDSLAFAMYEFLFNLIETRPRLTWIVLGVDNHVHVPAMKHYEWNKRSVQKNSPDAVKFSPSIKTDFSRSEETLVFNLIHLAQTNTIGFENMVAGLTFTHSGVLLNELIKDRYTRPLFMSMLFGRVFSYIKDSIKRFTLPNRDPVTIYAMTPVFNLAKNELHANTCLWYADDNEKSFSCCSHGLHIGEADMQMLWFYDLLLGMQEKNSSEFNRNAKSIQVEILTNDTDTYVILMLLYKSIIYRGYNIVTYVWSGFNQIIDVEVMNRQIIPTYVKQKLNNNMPNDDETRVFFIMFCLIVFGNDFYETPANFTSSGDNFIKLFNILKASEFNISNKKMATFAYDESGYMPTSLTFNTSEIARFTQALFYAHFYSTATNKSNDFKSVYSDGLADAKLKELWKEFVTKKHGQTGLDLAIRMNHPFYQMAETEAGMEIFKKIISERQLKSLLAYALDAFRYDPLSQYNKQLYEKDHPRCMTVAKRIGFILSQGNHATRDLSQDQALILNVDSDKIQASHDTPAYKQAWSRFDNNEYIAKYTNAASFPGDVSMHSIILRVGRIQWLMTYFTCGFFPCFSKQYDSVSPLMDRANFVGQIFRRQNLSSNIGFRINMHSQAQPFLFLSGMECQHKNDRITHVIRVGTYTLADFILNSIYSNGIHNFSCSVIIDNKKAAEFKMSLDVNTSIKATGLFVTGEYDMKYDAGGDMILKQLHALKSVYLDQMIALTHARVGNGNAWVSELWHEMTILSLNYNNDSSIKSEDRIYPDVQLLFKKIVAKFFINEDNTIVSVATGRKTLANADLFRYRLRGMPAVFEIRESKKHIVYFAIPTFRLTAAVLDACVDVQANSKNLGEYRIGLNYEIGGLDKSMTSVDNTYGTTTTVCNRGAIVMLDDCVFAGIEGIIVGKEDSPPNPTECLSIKTNASAHLYYATFPLYGIQYSIAEPHEILNRICSKEDKGRQMENAGDSFVLFDHTTVSADAINDANKNEPMERKCFFYRLSTSVDVCIYALPLLRYAADIHNDDIWHFVMMPRLAFFRPFMEKSFLSFMDWKLDQSMYLKAMTRVSVEDFEREGNFNFVRDHFGARLEKANVEDPALLPQRSSIFNVLTSQDMVVNIRDYSATWPLAFIRMIYVQESADEDNKTPFNINSRTLLANPDRTDVDLYNVLYLTGSSSIALSRAFPSCKNLFVKIDRQSDSEFDITFMFVDWAPYLREHYIMFHLLNIFNRENENTNNVITEQTDFIDFSQNPTILVSDLMRCRLFFREESRVVI